MITLLVADEDHVGGGRQVMSVGHGPHHEVSVFIMGQLLEWAHNYTLIRVRIPLIYDYWILSPRSLTYKYV